METQFEDLLNTAIEYYNKDNIIKYRLTWGYVRGMVTIGETVNSEHINDSRLHGLLGEDEGGAIVRFSTTLKNNEKEEICKQMLIYLSINGMKKLSGTGIRKSRQSDEQPFYEKI